MHKITDLEFKNRLVKRLKLGPAGRVELDREMLAAADLGSRQRLDDMLSEGANPNATDQYGNTGLILTMVPGCIMTLLESRANHWKPNHAGVLPFVYHLSMGNLIVARILQRHSSREKLIEIKDAAIEAAERAKQRGAWPHHAWVSNNLCEIHI